MTKRILAGALALLALAATGGPLAAGEGKVSKSACTFKGHRLYGKIQVVNSFPDLKIQVVTSFPDLKVKVVNSFADSCGEWLMVNSFPDLKIQFVNSFPDLKIEYVNSFPGVP